MSATEGSLRGRVQLGELVLAHILNLPAGVTIRTVHADPGANVVNIELQGPVPGGARVVDGLPTYVVGVSAICDHGGGWEPYEAGVHVERMAADDGGPDWFRSMWSDGGAS